MSLVYAYIRVSTKKQEEGVSLQEQREAIEKYCSKHALTVLDWFEEKETAAKQGRRVFSAVIKRLQRRQDVGIVIHKIDRSARNLKDWSIIQDLIDRGVNVQFAHESLDLHTRGGRLAADIQAVVAADYIRNLSQEVQKGIRGRLKQGLYPRQAPPGYLNHGKGTVKTIDPIQGPLVKAAFELYDTGQFGVIALTEEMWRLGLRNLIGRRVSINSMCQILKNTFYTGIIKMQSGETYVGIHEPLISKALFERVQERMSGRLKRRGLKHRYMFRKLLKCKHCNKSLLGELQKGRIYYRCHTRTCPTTCLREDRLSQTIEHYLAKVTLNPGQQAALAEECEKLLSERSFNKEELTRSLQLRHDQLSERLVRVTDAYVDRLIDEEAYTSRRNILLAEQASLTQEMNGIRGDDRLAREKLDKFLELAKRLCDKAFLEIAEQSRILLESITSNFSVDQNTIAITWRNGFRALSHSAIVLSSALDRDAYRTVVLEIIETSNEGQLSTKS